MSVYIYKSLSEKDLYDPKEGIKVGGRGIKGLRFTDDQAMMGRCQLVL